MLPLDESVVAHESVAGLFHLMSDILLCRSVTEQTGKESVRMEIQDGDSSIRPEKALK
jgi:hypothetical protein